MNLFHFKFPSFRSAWSIMESAGRVDSMDGAQYRRLWAAFWCTPIHANACDFILAHTKNRMQTHDEARIGQLNLA